MSLELEELQMNKTNLRNELQSLSKKEEILSEINEVLEERLALKLEEKIKPRREVLSGFVDAQINLKRLEDRFNKPKEYSKGSGEVLDKQEAQQQNYMVEKEQTVLFETRLRFENRVRLKENVVFSWSYQKLS